MSTGLRDLWGLAIRSPEAATGQEAEFRDEFLGRLARLNTSLQRAAIKIEPSTRASFTTQRDNAYAAYHLVADRIDPSDASIARGPKDQLLKAIDALSASVDKQLQAAEQAYQSWLSAEPELDAAEASIRHLADSGHEKAALLLKTLAAIEAKAAGRLYSEATQALESLREKLGPLIDSFWGQQSASDSESRAEPVKNLPAQGSGVGSVPLEPRVVGGAGGYTYEQHADNSIFILQSPTHGSTRFEVARGSAAHGAILQEIGDHPAFTEAPSTSPPAPPSSPPAEGAPSNPSPIEPDPNRPPNDGSGWDLEAAVLHLNAAAKPEPTGYCAQYVREAIEAGGVVLERTTSAKDYGPSLLKVGFAQVNASNYQAGDVVIMQAIGDHKHGHMQMYNGGQWVSDYRQRDFWPYTSSRPEFAVYRFPR